jgi:hypothetical protein
MNLIFRDPGLARGKDTWVRLTDVPETDDACAVEIDLAAACHASPAGRRRRTCRRGKHHGPFGSFLLFSRTTRLGPGLTGRRRGGGGLATATPMASESDQAGVISVPGP